MFNRLTNLSNRMVVGILIGVALISSGASLIVNLTSEHANFAEWGESWLQNFSTEMFGAFLTFILLELIVGGREKRLEQNAAREELKARLVRELGSSVNEVAKRAAEELKAHGWLRDGSLERANLGGAKLQRSDLAWADLRHASFAGTELQHADLWDAKLQNAIFWAADLQNANLGNASLQSADFEAAILKGANLENANLQGAKLEGTNLSMNGEVLKASFDESTILPDGTNWSPGTDMSRFTDPKHPYFWRPVSYQGKGQT